MPHCLSEPLCDAANNSVHQDIPAYAKKVAYMPYAERVVNSYAQVSQIEKSQLPQLSLTALAFLQARAARAISIASPDREA